MFVSFLKLKSVLDDPQILNENEASLRFHQQLKPWLHGLAQGLILLQQVRWKTQQRQSGF